MLRASAVSLSACHVLPVLKIISWFCLGKTTTSPPFSLVALMSLTPLTGSVRFGTPTNLSRKGGSLFFFFFLLLGLYKLLSGNRSIKGVSCGKCLPSNSKLKESNANKKRRKRRKWGREREKGDHLGSLFESLIVASSCAQNQTYSWNLSYINQ